MTFSFTKFCFLTLALTAITINAGFLELRDLQYQLGCDPSCATCSGPSDNQCKSCASGKYLQNSYCVSSCSAGYYTSGSNCYACNQYCATCSGSANGECNSCVSGRLYQDHLCTLTCSSGYVQEGTNCTSCSETNATAFRSYNVSALWATYSTWRSQWRLASAGNGDLTFTAIASNDIFIGISPTMGVSSPMLEIVIGGGANSQSVIRHSNQGADVYLNSSAKIASPTTSAHDWKINLNSATSTISVYQDGALLFSYVDSSFLSNVTYFSFGSWNNAIQYTNIMARVDVACPSSTFTTYISNSAMAYYPLWRPQWALPSASNGSFYFTALGHEDIIVGVSSSMVVTNPMIEIVIGGWSNTQSAIRHGSSAVYFATEVYTTPVSITNTTTSHNYTVTFTSSTSNIAVSRDGTQLFNYTDPSYLSGLEYFSLSSYDNGYLH